MRYSNKGAMDQHSMLLGLYNRLCRGSMDQRESLDRKNYGYRFYCPRITVCNRFEIIAIRLDPLTKLIFLLLDRGTQKTYFQDFLELLCKDIVKLRVFQILLMLH
jgi:hypothetical protein